MRYYRSHDTRMKTLTIVCPAYEEAEGIRGFYHVLKAEAEKLSGYQIDILFVVDGGEDRTYDILQKVAAEDSAVRVIRLSRNFGHQVALLAGIDHARGDAVITMDSDLQHPPALIPKLLAQFENGADIVYTVREKTEGIGLLRRLESSFFYWFVNRVSDVPIRENASDFRLISRRVADIIRTRIRERNLFLRGIVSWLGFKQASVPFHADKRSAGTSKYTFTKNVQFAIFGIISFSRKPLRAATLVGLLFALFGALFLLYTVYQYIVGEIEPNGYATIIVLISLFGGAQLVFLGIIGEYIGAIFDDVKGRPHYLIEDAINVDVR